MKFGRGDPRVVKGHQGVETMKSQISVDLHEKILDELRITSKESFDYDAFLSYSSRDKMTVLPVAERLKADGVSVWLDAWEIEPGDLIQRKIDDGLENSRNLVLFMSENAFSSEWSQLESNIFIFRDPSSCKRRFIPVRLDDSVVKASLKPFAYVDWRNKSEEEYSRLVAACRAGALVPLTS